MNIMMDLKTQLMDPKAANANQQAGHVGLALFSIVVITIEYFVIL